jgi:murein DD-endopeptidase MepM/ murein hydrolase activator NlpD
VIYEDLVVEGRSIGIGNILAALFHHEDRDYYAFYFVQDSIGDYFDEQSNSLRREFLKAPLKFSRISSRFSNSRYHPVLKIRRPHHGVDYAAPTGTPVQTIGDGKVIEMAYQKGGGGKYLKIKHNSVYTTTYMHLQGFAKGIREGVRVKQGDVIGYVGSTGLSTGPHLDFRVYKNGSAVDPLKMESPPAEPVKAIYRPQYDSVKTLYMQQLVRR